ncbi:MULTISPECIES: hypothetical protein [unclassified Mesorhizobium]|uniref:hypothetical protein n=1 Tax=unclassified Mesorhizobium TaxID=325217 RepID=UPI0030152E5D
MLLKKRVKPVNSLIFISDVDGGDAPYPVKGTLILATQSCISVGTFPEIEGATEIVMGPVDEASPDGSPDFSGFLETPTRHLVVTTVDGRVILKASVQAALTSVQIWLSHPKWPERIIIGWGEP